MKTAEEIRNSNEWRVLFITICFIFSLSWTFSIAIEQLWKLGFRKYGLLFGAAIIHAMLFIVCIRLLTSPIPCTDQRTDQNDKN